MNRKVLTGISKATLKGYGVEITGYFPDDEEMTHWIDGHDLKKLYGMNPARFLEEYEDDSAILTELFQSVNGITLNNHR